MGQSCIQLSQVAEEINRTNKFSRVDFDLDLIAITDFSNSSACHCFGADVANARDGKTLTHLSVDVAGVGGCGFVGFDFKVSSTSFSGFDFGKSVCGDGLVKRTNRRRRNAGAYSIGDQIKNAMGGSLGFIATIIGLGAIFGAMLEHSGGAQSLAKSLLKIFGQKRASWAMVVTVRFCSYHVELSPILALGVFAFCTERTINASR